MDCITAGNIMVHLFMQTQPKYFLNNQKLQYLLCIAQMASLHSGQPLFDEPIRNLRSNLSIEKIADTFMRNLPIQEGLHKKTALNMRREDFAVPYTSKRLYAIKESFSEEEKNLLIDVFIRFGAYSEKTLCKALNELKPLRSTPVWSYIGPKKLQELLTSQAVPTSLENNEIFSFCRPQFSETISHEETAEVSVQEGESSATVPENAFELAGILKAHTFNGLNTIRAGQKYTLYTETLPNKPIKDIIVLNSQNNQRLSGKLQKISDRIYCYSFIGVPADIKISIDI